MPLWHNKDKSENPCGATGWLVCPNSFSTDFPAKSRHNEGCQKVRCTIKDKENAYYPVGALAPWPGAFYQQGTGRWAVSFGPISKPTQADRRGSVLAPHKPVQAAPLRSVSERRTSIPSCRSVFVRPAGLLLGSLAAHRPRQLASLCFVQGARSLRCFAAIPRDAAYCFLPAGHAKHGATPTGVFDWRGAASPGLGAAPQQASGEIQKDIAAHCLPTSSPFRRPLTSSR